MDWDSLRTTARSYFADAPPSHGWRHVQRVENIATHIAEAEGADTTIVRLAALLHDIGRVREDDGRIDDHAHWGADEAADILRDHGIDDDTIDAVQHCIRAHRFSNDVTPQTLEARVIADADNLDALGATGIARTFCYGGEHRQPIAGVPDTDTDEETQLQHLQSKILSLQERMHTDTGRQLAADRHDYVARFVDRLQDEMQANA